MPIPAYENAYEKRELTRHPCVQTVYIQGCHPEGSQRVSGTALENQNFLIERTVSRIFGILCYSVAL